jgi:uncharacterized membrane protein SpoIIM required for sporulation/uncharacterized RDD family membrane protein YckC
MAQATVAAPRAYALSDRQVNIETPEHVSVGYELADLGSRFTAMLIDVLIITGIEIVLWLGMFAVGTLLEAGLGGGGDVAIAIALMLSFVVWWGYHVLYEGLRDGQTPGKKAMRIRVVQDGGFPVTLRAAAVRNLLKVLDIQPMPSCAVGALAMMLHPRTKRLGDMAAGTVVVRDRSGQPIPEERVPDAAQAALGAPRLADPEFATLSMYVQRRAALDFNVRAQLGHVLLQRIGPRLTQDPRRTQMATDAYLGLVHEEEEVRRRARGGGGRAGSAQATALFRRQKPLWDEYDRMLQQARKGGLAKMGEGRVSRFAAMYRELAADLARARTYGGSPELLYALERAVGAGHNLLYRAPARGWTGFRRWVTGGFPALARRRWKPIVLAAVLLYLPAGVTYAAVRAEPSRGRDLLPALMIHRAEEAEERESQGKGYVRAEEEGGMPLMASMIMRNNIGVTFYAFAGGLLAGVGTVLALVFNGIELGAAAGLFANYGASLYLWSFILPHGIIELTAICVAGGAGLWLGSAFVLPGRMRRRDALVVRGREAVSLIGGTAMMLVVAGTIEGFVSPSDLPREVKLALAALFAVGLFAYLLLAGRDEQSIRAAEATAQR